jgi:hypothetical protein
LVLDVDNAQATICVSGICGTAAALGDTRGVKGLKPAANAAPLDGLGFAPGHRGANLRAELLPAGNAQEHAGLPSSCTTVPIICFIETVSLEKLGEMGMNTIVENSTPTTVKGTVRRGRLPNGHYRTREYLTEKEIERLMKAAGNNRYGHRDATMILLAYRHGLRASELTSLRWEQVFTAGCM